jgi:hypothetical protein
MAPPPSASAHGGVAIPVAIAVAKAVGEVAGLAGAEAAAELAGLEAAGELEPLELQAASAKTAVTRAGANTHRLFRSP